MEVGTAFRMTEKEAGRNVLGWRKDRKREKGGAGKEERDRNREDRERQIALLLLLLLFNSVDFGDLLIKICISKLSSGKKMVIDSERKVTLF